MSDRGDFIVELKRDRLKLSRARTEIETNLKQVNEQMRIREKAEQQGRVVQ